jgi:hypothetical protein
MERDLEKLRPKLKDPAYAKALYAALCNNVFEKEWSCSWRYAGGLVARLRNEGEDYLDYYCSSLGPESDEPTEGEVTEEIREDLRLLGWKVL